MRRKFVIFAAVASAVLTMLVVAVTAQGPTLTPTEQLGKAIFFDQTLSLNGNQSCATCHDPKAGWVGPDADINLHGSVYEGSIPGAFGDRKPPSAAYATQSPILYRDHKSGLFIGGNFWDGRATGETLGNPAAEQAQGPFLNPMEQALPDASAVIARICINSSYSGTFMDVCGSSACSGDPNDVPAAYDCVGLSIAAYEASAEVNSFSSRFDYSRKGLAKLTPPEQRGHGLFVGKGKCAKCHIANGKEPLFTDFTFDNLGIPKNPDNPVYDRDSTFVDKGLGGFLLTRPEYAKYAGENMGKQKVPTLRNVDLRPSSDFVKAFGHNGYFKSLEGIVHFYNTRDVKPVCPATTPPYTEAQALAANCWPAPEVADNVNTAELGNLGLTPDDEAALVAFLKTLSDGHDPSRGKGR